MAATYTEQTETPALCDSVENSSGLPQSSSPSTPTRSSSGTSKSERKQQRKRRRSSAATTSASSSGSIKKVKVSGGCGGTTSATSSVSPAAVSATSSSRKRNHFVRNIIKDYIKHGNFPDMAKLRLSENNALIFEQYARKHLQNVINCALYFTVARKKNRTQVQDMTMACSMLGIDLKV